MTILVNVVETVTSGTLKELTFVVPGGESYGENILIAEADGKGMPIVITNHDIGAAMAKDPNGVACIELSVVAAVNVVNESEKTFVE